MGSESRESMGSLSRAHTDCEWKSAELLGREEEEVVKEQALENTLRLPLLFNPAKINTVKLPQVGGSAKYHCEVGKVRVTIRYLINDCLRVYLFPGGCTEWEVV